MVDSDNSLAKVLVQHPKNLGEAARFHFEHLCSQLKKPRVN